MSHAITSSRPLRYKRIRMGDFDAYRVNGTPADCVALGTHHWQHVDLVLSGINLGLNLGNFCWHSGTLAVAKQAALLGIRGVAFSAAVSENKESDFTRLDPYVAKVIDKLLEEQTMPLVNVNLPEKPKGIRWTRQSVRQYDGKVVPSKDPVGRPIYWFTLTPLQGAEEGTDRWAVEHNWVSISPSARRCDGVSGEARAGLGSRQSLSSSAIMRPIQGARTHGLGASRGWRE